MENCNTQDIKNAARKLSGYLEGYGCKVSHTRALEALAQAFGAKDFMTLRGMLGRARSSASGAVAWPETLPRLPKGQAILVYTEGWPTVEYQDAPAYARFSVDQAFLEKLVRRMDLVRAEGLAMAVDPSNIVEWSERYDSTYLSESELRVFPDSFFWRAYDGNGDAVETRSIQVLPSQATSGADGTASNLADALRQALSGGSRYAVVNAIAENAFGHFADTEIEEDPASEGLEAT